MIGTLWRSNVIEGEDRVDFIRGHVVDQVRRKTDALAA